MNEHKIMENKILRLCNKIYESNFNLCDVIVSLERDSCTLSCLNRNHTVFLEMNVDLDYFQGNYTPTNNHHVIIPDDIITRKLDLKRKITDFQQTHILGLQRLHHFFYGGLHEVPFVEFKSVAESGSDKVLIDCQGCQSIFISHYLKEALLDIPDSFGLNLHGIENPLHLEYAYDFFTVKAVVAPRITPVDEAEIVLDVDLKRSY